MNKCSPFLAAIVLAVFAAPAPAENYEFKQLRIGGAGYVTGVIQTNADVYCRTDVGGAYRWDGERGEWIQLVVAPAMPREVLMARESEKAPLGAASNAYNIESIAADDTGRVFLACGQGEDSWLLRSRDRGKTFELLPLKTMMAGNGEHRMAGERLQIDPLNPKVIYFGSRKEGLWVSRDEGGSWSQIPSLPVGEKVGEQEVGVSALAFDPSKGNPEEGCQRIFAGVTGSGIHETTDGGKTWTKLNSETDGPTIKAAPRKLVFADGALYYSLAVPSGSSPGFWKHVDGAWKDITPKDNRRHYQEFAVAPGAPNRIILASSGMQRLYTSEDGGETWIEMSTGTLAGNGRDRWKSATIPWVESSTVRSWLSVGDLMFDLHDPKRIWFAEGMGVWRSDDFQPGSPDLTFNNVSLGIEELVANDIATSPGRVTVTGWDRLGFSWDRKEVDHPPKEQILHPDFTSGWSVEAHPLKPDHLVVITSNHQLAGKDGNFSGTSKDGGKTWQNFSSHDVEKGVAKPQEMMFGEAVLDASDPPWIFHLPRFQKRDVPNNRFYRSSDGGATWEMRTADEWKGMNAYYLGSRRALAADGKVPGRIYLYSWKDPSAVLISSDRGDTWTTGGELPGWCYSAQLRATPGLEGDLWFATGFSHEGSADSRGLYHSADGGMTFDKIPNVDEAWAIGFGNVSESGPAILFYGMFNGQPGLYRSRDRGATWEMLVDYPMGIFDDVKALEGEADSDRVYVGFGGVGFVYGDPTGAN